MVDGGTVIVALAGWLAWNHTDIIMLLDMPYAKISKHNSLMVLMGALTRQRSTSIVRGLAVVTSVS
ncbi:hypothetical protein BDZ94DRAFT_1250341 [Collybia nuda]|uniref:Uncharacterized protein n=1 Tax=Collybia nuda TaxID=64659 RepID=A0A9P5YFR4_9AGAR|nr:hypothetical protein BDZ94DRAFT_1250341 [Collybia nuda]